MYPITIDKAGWKIPLYSVHECSDFCAFKLGYLVDIVEDLVSMRIQVDRQECALAGKFQNTAVNISKFDISKPTGDNGPLYNPDLVVVPETEFNIQISYPLLYPVTFPVSTENPVTLRTLLWFIKAIYKHIYYVEEQTATLKEYVFTDICPRSHSSTNDDDAIKDISGDTEGDCSICYLPFEDGPSCELYCKHQFHRECIEKWIAASVDNSYVSRKKCPLCRAKIGKPCEKCNDTGIVRTIEEHRVLPRNRRAFYFFCRPATDGIFGIQHADFEDILITQLAYTKSSKTVNVVADPFYSWI